MRCHTSRPFKSKTACVTRCTVHFESKPNKYNLLTQDLRFNEHFLLPIKAGSFLLFFTYKLRFWLSRGEIFFINCCVSTAEQRPKLQGVSLSFWRVAVYRDRLSMGLFEMANPCSCGARSPWASLQNQMMHLLFPINKPPPPPAKKVSKQYEATSQETLTNTKGRQMNTTGQVKPGEQT